ncbi:hypothetical protein [Lentzea sp. HUAS12]|uniref:hypothetical protein n=1 Tax=Lentzea sp. HUAS12 TaxID=2951806 RepID=UPI00209D43C9|nr:hypothetical protein [Lentzea sp. HUAS12]USX56374.1 hypothetical protein ND450_20405 [Lentzea sp. HUAS12]
MSGIAVAAIMFSPAAQAAGATEVSWPQATGGYYYIRCDQPAPNKVSCNGYWFLNGQRLGSNTLVPNGSRSGIYASYGTTTSVAFKTIDGSLVSKVSPLP